MGSDLGKRSAVLFLDDDPQHLKLYQWVIERGPFRVIPVLVGSGALELPEVRPDVVALDYRLKGTATAVDIAKMLKAKFPGAPILVLSELEWMPRDIADYAAAFVRKGEPDKLINTLSDLTSKKQATSGASANTTTT